MRRYHLAEFEEILLLTVAILRSEAYGVSVKKEIEQHLARKVSVGALQIALKQLEDKGYLKSYEGEVTSERSGSQDVIFLSLHWAKGLWRTQRIFKRNYGKYYQR